MNVVSTPISALNAYVPGSRGWTAAIETVTPEIAAEMLESGNRENRKLRRVVVDRYAASMSSGDWLETTEPLVVAKTGRLLNGQHRLHAVVKSGTCCRFFVVRNVDEEVFSAIDRGVSRSVADALRMSPRLAEIASFAIRLRRNRYGGYAVSDPEVREMAQFLANAHETLTAKTEMTRKVFSTAPCRLAACLRMMDAPDATEYVLQTYYDLVTLRVGSLPPIAQSWVAQASAGKFRGGSMMAPYIFAAAWTVFDADHASVPKLVIKDLDFKLNAARTVMLRMIEGTP